MQKRLIIVLLAMSLVTILLSSAIARPKEYIYHEYISCCEGGGWEVRDYNPDGSYTSINLCDGGGAC